MTQWFSCAALHVCCMHAFLVPNVMTQHQTAGLFSKLVICVGIAAYFIAHLGIASTHHRQLSLKLFFTDQLVTRCRMCYLGWRIRRQTS